MIWNHDMQTGQAVANLWHRVEKVKRWGEGHALEDFLPLLPTEPPWQAADDSIRHKVALKAAVA